MKVVTAIALAMVSACATAAEPPASFELVSTTYSPQRTFQVEQEFAESQGFDHTYCEALCWLGSHALVLHAWRHMSGEHALLKDWYCIYDIKSRKVSLDLTTVNTGAFNGKVAPDKNDTHKQ